MKKSKAKEETKKWEDHQNGLEKKEEKKKRSSQQ